jgi:hypothetical protein
MSTSIVDSWGVGFWDPKKKLNLYKTFLVMQGLYDGTFVYMDMVHPKSHRPRLKQKKKFILCSWKFIWNSTITFLKVFSCTLIVHSDLNLGLMTKIRHDKGQNGLQEVQGMVST